MYEDLKSIKDWALGSYWKYGDRPFCIHDVRVVRESELPERFYLVEWKIRRDGFKPVRTFISEREMIEAD